MSEGWSAGPARYSLLQSTRADRSVLQHQLTRATWRRIVPFARPYRWHLATLIVLLVVSSVTTVASPLILQRIIDDGVTPGDRSVVVFWACVVAGIALLDAVISVVQRWYTSTVGEGVIADLRTAVFNHVQRQSIAFFTHSRTGNLVNRVNSDVLGAQQTFSGSFVTLVSNVLNLVGVLVAMTYLSPQITLAFLLLIPLMLAPGRWMGRRLQRANRERMDINADLGNRMTERFSVSGALLVKLYGHLPTEDTEYRDQAQAAAKAGRVMAMTNRTFMAMLVLVGGLTTALVYGIGGLVAIDGGLTVGALLALAALALRGLQPITTLANLRVDIMSSLVSFERVFEVLDLAPSVPEPTHPKPLPAGPLRLQVAGARYVYPDPVMTSLGGEALEEASDGRDVLRGITLDVEPGSMVALVGPSGAGKTTLAGLLARLHDPTEGHVTVSGVDLRDVASADLRSRIGMVPQDAHMFHDTIRANLAYAKPDASDAQMRTALADAHILDLVDALPDGLDTVVGDRGHRLSGGEKQRLALARLLLKAPEVVVLDEATAHLDSESEAAVQRALATALEGRTSVVIAHRLSTVRRADVIAVLDGGRVVERGTHDELLAVGGLYAELYRTQFADQENPT